jgi:hypothetical protein
MLMEGMHMKTELNQNTENNPNLTDIIPREQIIQKIDSYLTEEGLNIAKDDYCYLKIVGNHIEVGRAKIILEE